MHTPGWPAAPLLLLKLVVYTLVDAAAADLGFDQKQLPTEGLDAVSGYDQRPSRADQVLLPPASLPPSAPSEPAEQFKGGKGERLGTTATSSSGSRS